MIIEFGRVHRGVVWHVVIPGSRALSGKEVPLCFEAGSRVAEVNQNQPPRGGRVCPRCADAVQDMVAAVDRAGDPL